MNIVHNQCDSITLLSSLVTTTGTITVSMIKNCCSTPVTRTINLAVSSDDYEVSTGSLTLNPTFFTPFTDGVYSFTINRTEDEDITSDTTCAFIDCETKCNLTKILTTLANGDKSEIQQGVDLAMLHYTLTNTSNCGCNCEDLCMMWKKLSEAINSIDPTKNPYCGC